MVVRAGWGPPAQESPVHGGAENTSAPAAARFVDADTVEVDRADG